MSDETATSSSPAPESVPQAGVAERLKQAALGSFEKFKQVVKPGRGRPRKDGTPKSSDKVQFVPTSDPISAPASDAAPAAVVGASIGSAIGPDLMLRIVSAGVRGFWSVPDAIIRWVASGRQVDMADLDTKLEKTAPLTEELDSLAVLLPVIAKKHGWDLENSPEGLAAIIVGLQTIRKATVLGEVLKSPKKLPVVGIVPIPENEANEAN